MKLSDKIIGLRKSNGMSQEDLAEKLNVSWQTISRKVVWDGVNAHVILFGVKDEEIEYPKIAAVASDNNDDADETDELVTSLMSIMILTIWRMNA